MEFIDLKAQYRALQGEIDANIQRILAGAHFIGGEEVAEFEEKLAAYVGRRHCVTCGNGTDALQLVYMAYGIGAGDAVFCPDMTFIASVEPACMLGAAPVFCDIEPDTYNLDPVSLEAHIQSVLAEGTLRPRAVVAVDFLGNPAKYDELDAICKKYGLLLIEDAAQGTGASYKGRKCGSFGDIATTSFFPSKPLGCYGDGGAVFTDDDEIAELLRSYKVHGKGPKGKYDNVRIGLNSRLDTLQAGVMLPKLAVLDQEIAMRQEIAERYHDAFAGKLQLPVITDGCVSAYAQYCMLGEGRGAAAEYSGCHGRGEHPQPDLLSHAAACAGRLRALSRGGTSERRTLCSLQFRRSVFSLSDAGRSGRRDPHGAGGAVTNGRNDRQG